MNSEAWMDAWRTLALSGTGVEAIGLALDLLLLVALALVAWRLGGATLRQGDERVARVEKALENLRGLAAVAEGQARDLDGRLEDWFARWQTTREREEPLIDPEGREAALGSEPGAETLAPDSMPARALPEAIRAAVEGEASVAEVAQRNGTTPARVRVLVELERARRERRGVATA